MAAAGLLTSWAAALFAAWAFVGGLVGHPPGHPARRSAERALVASAVAAAGATALLLALLLTGDVTVSFVARSVARNVPAPYRLAAIWSLPAGAVLPTAVLVAVAGRIAAARAHSSLGVAVTGAIVMSLCAASLAAAPFSTLPWTPTEGLGLAPVLQQPWSVVGRAALTIAIALATAGSVAATEPLAQGPPLAARSRTRDTLVLGTLAALAVAMWASARGAYAAGVAGSPVPPAAWGGALVPALVATLFAWRGRRAEGVASLGTALGALGLMCVVVLAPPGRGVAGAPAMSAFAAASLGAATWGAIAAGWRAGSAGERVVSLLAVVTLAGGAGAELWLTDGDGAWMAPAAQWLLAAGGAALVLAAIPHRVATPERARARRVAWVVAGGVVGGAFGLWLEPSLSPTVAWSALAGLAMGAAVLRLTDATGGAPSSLPRILLCLAAAGAALAAAGEGRAQRTSIGMPSGGEDDVAMRFGPPVTLVHQGVSRFPDRNAHVIAVALEPRRAGQPLPLLSVEQREYVDSRDETLGPAISRPAILGTPIQEVRLALSDVTTDEGVRLSVTVVPFGMGWTVALALLMVAALTQAVTHPTRTRSGVAPGGTLE